MRRWLPGSLATLTILAQIIWPLATGSPRDGLTAATVVLFALSCASHAWIVRGPLWMLGWLVISGGIGLLAEVLGTNTGFPFGHYSYADRLGPTLFGVPAVIPLAWAMMSYPCLLAARRLTTGPLKTAAIAAFALASWDLFLDPQMVGEGHWTWSSASVILPGVEGIPLQNFVAWFGVALLLMLILDRLPRRRSDGDVPPDGVPAVLLTWTYVSNILLNSVFAHRPSVALWGGIAMGLVVIPYLWRVWTARA